MLRSTGVPGCKQLKLSMTTESCLHPGTFSPKLRICTQPPANRSLPTASRYRQTGSYEHPSQGQQQGWALSQYQEYSSGARPPCTSRCAFQPFEAQGLGPLWSASQRVGQRLLPSRPGQTVHHASFSASDDGSTGGAADTAGQRPVCHKNAAQLACRDMACLSRGCPQHRPRAA